MQDATTLAEFLGTPTPTTDGADDDMARIALEDGSFVLFSV